MVVTDRSERGLAESFFAAASELFVAFDGDGAVVRANRSARRHFAVEDPPLDARGARDLLHPDDRDLAAACVRDAYLGKEVGSTRIRHRTSDGRELVVEWSFGRHEERDLVFAVGRDVTEAERQERALSWARHILETTTDMVFIYDSTGEIVWTNDGAESMGGFPQAEMIGTDGLHLLHPDEVDEIVGSVSALRPDQEYTTRARGLRRDGSWAMIDMKFRRDAVLDGVFSILRDVSAEFETERELIRSRRFFDAAGELFVVVDSELVVVDLNATAVRRLGATSASELAGRRVRDVWDQEMEAQLVSLPVEAWRTFERTEELGGGTVRVLAWDAHRSGDDEIHLVARDVTEERRLTDELSHRATTDELTGLANRSELTAHLAGALDSGLDVAVLLLDLDQFKLINDSMGHEAGDELLVGVAERLRRTVAHGDLVGRLGGDEFVVVSLGAGLEEAAALARRICRSFVEPLQVSGRVLQVSASIGVAAGTRATHATADLLREADTAAYRAKDLGRNRYELFNGRMREEADERVAVEHGLRAGLRDHDFVVHYQAVNDLRTGAVTGFEALVRWDHPQDGLQYPDRFIGVAEASGLIVDLGAQVLDLALAQLVEWQRHHPQLSMAINVSSIQLAHPGFPSTLQEALARHGVDPMGVVLELTESALVHNVEHAATVLHRLRSFGVGLAIDDFGTGYSALGYLRDLPFDIVKIDRSFGAEVDRNEATAAIVGAAVTLGHSLGTKVVAEGVETESVAVRLAELGCDLAQGYLFHRPAPAAEATRYLEQRSVARRSSPELKPTR